MCDKYVLSMRNKFKMKFIRANDSQGVKSLTKKDFSSLVKKKEKIQGCLLCCRTIIKQERDPITDIVV